MTSDFQQWIPPLRRVHAAIREAVIAACEANAVENLAAVDHESAEDTIYAVDRVSEEELLAAFSGVASELGPLVLIAEGLTSGGSVLLPHGSSEETARWRVIVDPIDGTRGLMYQKRSAWILTGVARNRGSETTLADIEVAMMSEIPTLKQHLCDSVWSLRGEGVEATRYDRLNRRELPLRLQPSTAATPEHGFATVARFFPGTRALLGAVDEEIFAAAIGGFEGRASCFEDQYISSGGQLYELMSGRDRLVIDVRAMALRQLSGGKWSEPCAHPYDLCTESIARELGVVVTDVGGNQLSAPLDLDTPVDWTGYANARICELIHPLLQAALQSRDLWPDSRG